MSTKADGHVIIEIDVDGKQAEKHLQSFEKQVNQAGTTAQDVVQQIDQASESLENASNTSKAAEDSVKKVGKAADDAEKEMADLGDASEETQKNMAATSATCAALCAGLVAIGAQAVKASTEFGSSFAKTKTIMDENAMSAAQMRQEIMALSSLSGMKGSTVSEAVYQAISGSVATEDATAFVEKANKLAVSGFTSLSNATDVLTTTLNAYGMEAERVGGISNVLIQTQNLGKTSVDELAMSMGKAISTGSAYGVNLENLSTAYVELTRGGIATAEATTYISAMLNELGDSGSVVGGILQEKTGKSFGQLMAEGLSLGDVMQLLSDTVDGNAEALMGLWSSQEAGKASNAIMTQSVEDFNAVLAQMNAEMSGTTGTTDKAYATMTETSEFIDMRFRNSINNLGIAFGDNLSPAVNWVKSSLTGIIEGFTEIVQENPILTAALAGIAVGAGALAVALAAYTLKAKLATSQTAKLTAAMMTNPVVLAVTAIAALGATVFTLATASDEASVSVEELTVKSTALRDTVRDTEKAYADTKDSIEGNVTLARKYADRLRELESMGSLTADQQEEYNSLLEKMKVVMPDLNYELDEQTGMLLEGADALQKQIDGWYELAVAQALQEKFTAQIQAQAEAEAELATRIAARNRKEAESSVAEEKRDVANAAARKAESDMNYYQSLYKKETSRREDGTKTMSDAEYDSLMVKYQESADALRTHSAEELTYGTEVERLETEISNLNIAIEENERVISENATAVQNAEDVYRSYVEGLEDAEAQTETAAGTFSQAVEEWNSASQILQDAYNQAFASARESIEGQIGLFENMGTVTASSVSGMISSLDSQIAYLDQYATNMQLAAERGIDQGLLQKLSDGSKESAEILAGLVSATDEQIQEINEKFAKVGEGKNSFAEAMTEYTGVVEDEKQIMVDLAEQVGLDMSDALTRGLLDGYSAYKEAWLQYHNVGNARPILGNDGLSMYAEGTYYAQSGLALVGEAGPELVYLRGGERILTAEETQEVFAAATMPARSMSVVGTGAPAIVGSGAGHLHASIEVPLYIDGREFARANAEVMGEEMDWSVM